MTAYHAPKRFPKSPDQLLAKAPQVKPMNAAQWQSLFRSITDSSG